MRENSLGRQDEIDRAEPIQRTRAHRRKSRADKTQSFERFDEFAVRGLTAC